MNNHYGAIGLVLIALGLICFEIVGLCSAAPIMQGQCVELNKTYDISGVGWYNEKIVYYGRWYDAYQNDDNSSIEAVFKIPSGISKLQNFWIDPEFFGKYPGYWYNFNDLVEKNSNARLFYVADRCAAPEPVATPAPVKQDTSNFVYNKTILPPKPSGYDVLMARGDTIEILNKSIMRYWIFNNAYNKYDIVNSLILLSASDFRGAPPGKYILGIVFAGNNSIIEEYYNAHDSIIESVFKHQSNEYVLGLQSISLESRSTVQAKLEKMVKNSYDDKIEYMTIGFDDPVIQVMQYQQIDTGGKSYLDIRGYTNVKEGTQINATLESETANDIRYKRIAADATVVEYGYSNWRQWKLLLPFQIDDLPNGKHYVVITVPQGARVVIEPYIREEPADHYQPNKTVRFVDNSPFIPVPTPIVYTNETVKTVEVVKVEVKKEVVKEPVDYIRLSDTMIGSVVPYIFPVVVLLYLGRVAAKAYVRGQKKK